MKTPAHGRQKRAMTTSKPLYIYLQRPDTGDWVTVGRYVLDAHLPLGHFRYAPSYLDSGLPWSIDPVHLPLGTSVDWPAHRYDGLHDVLRDACPDAWGQSLLQREHHLHGDVHPSTYLRLARNGDRWGALAMGSSRKPSIDFLRSPALPQIDALAAELLAMFERRPPIDARLRKNLIATPSIGGARPKATVVDGAVFWLVKPVLPSDTVDIPALEHFALTWAAHAGIDAAHSVHHQRSGGLSVLRVRRFDREADRRRMTLSGATLLGTEYPGGTHASWSYPRLAEVLRQIGVPPEDRMALFDRMVFNAMIGNYDDHPRNHAAYFHPTESRWRLSPAFDLVPYPDEHPSRLAMQLSAGRFDISRQNVLADALRFGFTDDAHARARLDEVIARTADALPGVDAPLDSTLLRHLSARVALNQQRLQAG